MNYKLIKVQGALLVTAMLSWSGAVHASCGAAFCAVNTNWNLRGLAAEPGWRLDLRYEYINQDQPMAGSNRVAVGQIPHHHDEVKTINRNYVGTLDYTVNEKWAVAVTTPISDRVHTHVHNHHGALLTEKWDFTQLGDVRVLGRYQLQSANQDQLKYGFYGLNFGLKLPTGERDERNAGGDLAERSLQPGTGTTDLLLGAYYNGVLLNSNSSWFVQGLWQAPLNSRDDYRPGQRLSFDAGYRYEASSNIGLMLQLNALYRECDSGLQAEPEDTGSKSLFVSPGISYAINKGTQVYGYIQEPLYQYVNGVQLTADRSAVVGLSVRF